jgi:hypothetical protein
MTKSWSSELAQIYLENKHMRIYREVSLAVFTASLFFCQLANAGEPPSGAETSAPDPASAGQAPASPTPASTSDWDVNTTSYAWLAGGHGSLSGFGYNAGWKASPSDLLSHADFGIMNLVGVRYKRLVVLTDFYWAPFTITKTKVFNQLPDQPVLTSKLKYTQIMLSPEVGYRVVDNPKLKIDALTGYRYWYNGVSLDLTTAQRGFHAHASSNWADPLVGSRIMFPLTPKLRANIWGDVGGWGAGAQLDYQMVGALTYMIKPKWGVDVAWRYMYYDYGTVVHSVNSYSGLAIGVTHRWCCAE